MTEVIKQITSKSKAKDIINSCVNGHHFNGAENYIELYNHKFDDFLGYNELKRELQKARVESLTPIK